MDLIEELVCSKEGQPHTHLAPVKITKETGISPSSNGEKRNLSTKFKHLKTPQMSEGAQNRRENQSGSLRARFETNIHIIKKWFSKIKKISFLKFLSIC